MRNVHRDAKVVAIIVTFNPDIDVLENQWKSIRYQVDAVVYVDNGSNNSVEIKRFLKEKAAPGDCIYSVFNEKNRGIGCAQNQGIELARQLFCDFVLFLDHDSVLKDSFIDFLIAEYKDLTLSGVKVAAVGPVYINENTKEEYPITRYVGPFIKRIHPNKLTNIEASFLIASGSLIPLDVLSDVGLMNEDLFVDYVDVEWSFRARKYGYRLYAITKARMHHQIGDRRISLLGRQISVHSPVRRYFLTRNSFFMIRSPYITVGYKLRESVFNIIRVIVFAFLLKDRKEYLHFTIRAIKDGLKGSYGPLK